MDTVKALISSWVVAVPLLGIAGSAIAYVVKLWLDARNRRHERFYEIMKKIDDKDAPLAGKMAAVYQLRQYKEHSAFVVRFCDEASKNIEGKTATMLANEFIRTRDYMQRRSK